MAYKPKKGRVVLNSRGIDVKRSYSDFWMNSGSASERFGGWNSEMRSGSDIVKLIKLANYRRAITNFVKITTKQEIPVMWAGDDSFTDGKRITLATDIQESNFDVTVGLALHESAHIILSDFALLAGIVSHDNKQVQQFLLTRGNINTDDVKQLLNWIEDRRIDNYIFTTSPGYKAYYHKLYEYYFNNDVVTKGLKSPKFRDFTNKNCWDLHIMNMINPAFNPKAMPGLEQVTKIIDLPTIGRLKSSQDALDVTLEVLAIISKVMSTPPSQQLPKPKPQQAPAGGGKGEESKSQSKESKDSGTNEETPEVKKNESSNPTAQAQEKQSNESGDSNESNDDDSIDWESDKSDVEETSPAENQQIMQALEKQKSFTQGKVAKKGVDKKTKRKLESLQKDSIELQTVGDKESGIRTSLIYDYTNPAKLAELVMLAAQDGAYIKTAQFGDDAIRDDIGAGKFQTPLEKEAAWSKIKDIRATLEASGMQDFMSLGVIDKHTRSRYMNSIARGLEVGGLLGKKLQLHNESRERVDSRLRNGKIDNKRLSHAGYGIEAVFKQIHVDKHKKANLCITLDGSGSMSGEKWASAIQMTVAIAKAVSYTQGISLQVNIRVSVRDNTRNSQPAVLLIYNSKTSKLNHLTDMLGRFSPSSLTPEGMALEAIAKKGLLVDGTSEVDSYLLNISDGQPYLGGNYSGEKAWKHTKKVVDSIRTKHNIQILSFFMSNSNHRPYKDCTKEYLERNGFTSEALYNQFIQKTTLNNFNSTTDGKAFKIMYGKDIAVVDPNSAIGIARELNKKFMSAKVSV